MNEKRRPSDPDGPPSRAGVPRGTPIAIDRRDIAIQRTRILLVDDSPAILSFLRARLVKLGCEFLDAEDGDRALRLAKLMPIDLIVVDVNMPGMDGITFVRELRGSDHARLRAIPVILLTADRDPALRERGIEAGAQDFVHKPVDGDVLLAAVEKLLRGSGPP